MATLAFHELIPITQIHILHYTILDYKEVGFHITPRQRKFRADYCIVISLCRITISIRETK